MTLPTFVLLASLAPLPSTPIAAVVPPVPSIGYVCPTGFTTERTATGGWTYTCEPLGDTVLNWMTVAYFGLVVADIDLTLRMTQQHRAVEKNYVMRPLVATPGGMAVKTSLNAVLALAIYRFVPAQKRRRVMGFLLGVNGAVVAWNGYQYATLPWPTR